MELSEHFPLYRNYGTNTWGDLFNARQKLALITFVEKVKEAYQKMVEEGTDTEYAKAVVSYLALCIMPLFVFQHTCYMETMLMQSMQTFARQAIPMIGIILN